MFRGGRNKEIAVFGKMPLLKTGNNFDFGTGAPNRGPVLISEIKILGLWLDVPVAAATLGYDVSTSLNKVRLTEIIWYYSDDEYETTNN